MAAGDAVFGHGLDDARATVLIGGKVNPGVWWQLLYPLPVGSVCRRLANIVAACIRRQTTIRCLEIFMAHHTGHSLAQAGIFRMAVTLRAAPSFV